MRATSSSRCSAARARGCGGGPRAARASTQGEDHHAKVADRPRGRVPRRRAQHLAARAGRDAPTAASSLRGAHARRPHPEGHPPRPAPAPGRARARRASAAAPAGDLYLEIEFKPHPRFRVEGADVYVDLPLAPWEAALGATRRRGDARGHGAADDPARARTAGRKLRLKGRGLPGAGRHGRRPVRRAHDRPAAGRQRQGARRLHGAGQGLRRLRSAPPARRLTMDESRIRLRGSVVEEEVTLTTVELAAPASRRSTSSLGHEGVLQPSGDPREHWRFSGRRFRACAWRCA